MEAVKLKGHLSNPHADFWWISESVLNGQTQTMVRIPTRRTSLLHFALLHLHFCGGKYQHFGPCRLTFRSYRSSRMESTQKNPEDPCALSGSLCFCFAEWKIPRKTFFSSVVTLGRTMIGSRAFLKPGHPPKLGTWEEHN